MVTELVCLQILWRTVANVAIMRL